MKTFKYFILLASILFIFSMSTHAQGIKERNNQSSQTYNSRLQKHYSWERYRKEEPAMRKKTAKENLSSTKQSEQKKKRLNKLNSEIAEINKKITTLKSRGT